MQHLHHSVLKKHFARLNKLAKKASRWFNNKPSFLIAIGLFLLFVGASRYYQLRILSFSKTPTETQTAVKGELPTQIIIPSINVDLPIEVGAIKNGIWQISYDKATFLGTSGRPGTGDNVVIYGHNKKAIFGNLPYLSIGQKIFIKTADSKIYTYEVYQKDFVGADRIDLVSKTDKEELTIYTCWGFIDSQRAVLKAKPI